MEMRLKKAAVATAVLAALLAMPLAVAGHDPNKKGFFIDVGGESVTPGNVNTPILFSVPYIGSISSTTDHSTDVTWSDFGSDLSWNLGVGYSWGKKGSLKVSYWGYSDKQNSSGTELGNQVGAYNFFGIGPVSSFGYSSFYDMHFDFDQELKASVVDVEFSRAHAMDDLVMTWGVGLRVAHFEDNVDGTYTADPAATYYGPWRFPAERRVKSDGWGFSSRIGAEYDFTDLFGIGSNLRVGFLNSSIDSSAKVTDLDGYYAPAGTTLKEDRTQNDEVANTVDFNFDLIFHAGEHVGIKVGYFYSTWSDLPTPGLSRELSNSFGQPPIAADENRDRISWSGPRVAVHVTF
jgi:hypothetical protein